ncbi:hypothetical protein A2U01_0002170 [Trifolium medium]|uniref:Uncharacterized protein n=1 Tax=Trifolium medium TaxID=97028 RepID=A0A392M4S6_9FABA|nr:hypothetical protein [Trifolium medium]
MIIVLHLSQAKESQSSSSGHDGPAQLMLPAVLSTDIVAMKEKSRKNKDQEVNLESKKKVFRTGLKLNTPRPYGVKLQYMLPNIESAPKDKDTHVLIKCHMASTNRNEG